MDSKLYLTNASGSELTFNDDYLNAVASRDSQITYKVPTSGTYHLKVTNGASNPTSGNFTISAKTKQSTTASATITKWKQVACGSEFTVAIKNDGALWAWGYNAVGQLGDGTRTNSSVPVPVTIIN